MRNVLKGRELGGADLAQHQLREVCVAAQSLRQLIEGFNASAVGDTEFLEEGVSLQTLKDRRVVLAIEVEWKVQCL